MLLYSIFDCAINKYHHVYRKLSVLVLQYATCCADNSRFYLACGTKGSLAILGCETCVIFYGIYQKHIET